MRHLIAIPVFNEAKHLTEVLAAARRYCPNILVVNDGSTDGTAELLAAERDILRVDHAKNHGYGAAIISAFEFALRHDYDVLITMDCDGQHEPARIPVLLEAIHDSDIVSGSRYLRDFRQDTPAPTDRRDINATITSEINARFGLDLTDAFCGFKAYRRAALEKLHITESGWGMPLQLWVQAARQRLKVKEIGVPRLYLDPSRAFGGVMNDATKRLAYYRGVLESAERDVLPTPRNSDGVRVSGAAVMSEFRAPTGHGEILAVPGFDAIPELVNENRRKLDRGDIRIGGLPLQEFRSAARREVLALTESPGTVVPGFDDSAPLLLAGHQPELSHPGVWVKNFALSGLAKKLGGISLHLIADTDTLKSTSLRLPLYDHDPRSVRLDNLAFDTFAGEVAYECRPILDSAMFRSFPERAEAMWENWGFKPLLPRVWKRETRQGISESFTAIRRQCEHEWGCRNLEVTVSRISQTDALARFARHILDDLPRFREVYNAALHDYRMANGIRSANHPAPDLASGEAPFWVRTDGCRRERATTKSDVRSLRPRALTLTLFARVCLGDFFIHGIGGGKYDEVTDVIIRDYFGIEPPAYQVLSATVHLPLPTFPSSVEDVKHAERRLRDYQWNPQRFVPGGSELVARHSALAADEPPYHDHAARKQWYRDLRDVKANLRGLVGKLVPKVEAGLAQSREEANANAILQRRDYSWVLYPEETLRPFLQRFLSL